MPARRPAQARRIELPATAAPAEPAPEEVELRRQARRERILAGGYMHQLVGAIIEAGEPLEIDAGTHIVTITVAEK